MNARRKRPSWLLWFNFVVAGMVLQLAIHCGIEQRSGWFSQVLFYVFLFLVNFAFGLLNIWHERCCVAADLADAYALALSRLPPSDVADN